MVRAVHVSQRREEALSRASIVEASIEILDGSGEDGLTFRTLSERLVTGPGAIYAYVANKSDLLTAACDAIVARTMAVCPVGVTSTDTIRALALGVFDAMDAHPWIGSALLRAELNSPMVRILERVGQQVRALGVPEQEQWATVAALMNYILGVGGQNASNGQVARKRGLNRSDFLEAMASVWLQLNSEEYPFTHSIADQLSAHNDRMDFLTGIDLILKGIESPQRIPKPHQQNTTKESA